MRRPLGILVSLAACSGDRVIETSEPYVIVLGIAQDAGVPQAGCEKPCCASGLRRRVSCIAVVDPASKSTWIFDATPDFPSQSRDVGPISGIFLSHAHIGHYTGLMHLGREVMGAKSVPVYAMPRMREFLSKNGPWDQLVRLQNISLHRLEDGVRLNERISVAAFRVPHRDEYSETVGFRIQGPKRVVVFIPDIDKWEKWDRKIEDVVAGSDVAYLDGTFFKDGEIPGRNMSEIPHPFIVESMKRLAPYASKVRFIHLNHTNPALRPDGRREVERAGFRVAEELERIGL
jgi:pyrroloquinoline quinone biosynthesis protein B